MSRANRLMVGFSTALVSVLALGGYYAYSNAPAAPVESKPQPIADAKIDLSPIPERVAAMLASMDNRIEQYRADAMANAAQASVNEDALRSAIRSGVDEALAATRDQMESIGQANAAAQTVSVELGEKAQQLLDLVANQAADTLAPAAAPAPVMVAAAAAATPAPARTDSAALEEILNLPPTAAGRAQRMISEDGAKLIRGMGLRLREVHFSSGSSDLSPGAQKRTRQAAKALKELGAKKIRLVGFSDTTGSKSRNAELSARRARAVAQLLAANGVPASRIEVVARGESPGPISTADGVDEPLNRCVGIFAVN